MKINLKPFESPSHVLMGANPGPRQDGFQGATRFPLKEVDSDSLSKLCDQFRKDVFTKAGKRDPAIKIIDRDDWRPR